MSEKWRGIGKLTEEAGEILQLLGKLIAFPDGKHPDGKGNLPARLEEEIADLYAALDYFTENSLFDRKGISKRRALKLARFRKWKLSGLIRKKTK